jgi:ParB-like chromosome segregation protein Spo0J
MASAAKIAQVESVLQIVVDDIVVGDRIGILWPDKAAALGQLIAASGQRTPINIRANGPKAAKPWTLVAGWHRLEGAKLAGLRIIDAIQVYGDFREIEAEENLHRRSLAPIERACFVRAVADAAEARLKDQHDGLSPEQIAVRARWDAMRVKAKSVERDDNLNNAEADHTRCNLHRVYGWREETARAMGMSLDQIKRDLALHRAIIAPFPDLYEALARHPIVGENASALREIASYAEPSRRAIIEGLIQAADMTLAQALEGLALKAGKAPTPTGATKYMDNAGSNIARLTLGQQKDWAPAFTQTLKPQALHAFAAAIAARIEELGV